MDVPPDVIALGVALILRSKIKRKWAKEWLLDEKTYPNIKLLKELAGYEPEDIYLSRPKCTFPYTGR
jgi:hypothetical protein